MATVATRGPPSTATLTAVTPLDGKVRVDLAPATEDDADDVTRFFVDLAVDPLDGGVPSWRNVGGEVGTRVTLTGLENGVHYLVRGIAIDEADNRGAASEPVGTTPVPSSGFWENYRTAGGSEVGCGASIGGLLVSALAGRGRRGR